VFLKYIHRNNVSMPGAAGHTRGPEQQVKGQYGSKVSAAGGPEELRLIPFV